ncbi:MAG: hypothetical protein OYG31_01950 [Candidatus Kaiserbacteria bacterium]|nr:hypothetical protein [Candidatus Kaiserbacteria bacterium]
MLDVLCREDGPSLIEDAFLLFLVLSVPLPFKEIPVRWLVGIEERDQNKPGPPIDEEKVYWPGGTASTRAKLRPGEFYQVDDQKRNAYADTVTQHRKNVYLILLTHAHPPLPGTVCVM